MKYRAQVELRILVTAVVEAEDEREAYAKLDNTNCCWDSCDLGTVNVLDIDVVGKVQKVEDEYANLAS